MNLAEQTKKILEILDDDFPLNRLGLILQNKDMILEWLESKTFKEKYTKHPYPPLVDPSKVLWEQTDPNVAWDLNLPLPPFYSLLFSVLPGAGGSAFYKFLKLCGVDCYSKWYGHHLAYLENYQIFSQSQNYKALFVTDFINPNAKKFWSLIDKKIPMIYFSRGCS